MQRREGTHPHLKTSACKFSSAKGCPYLTSAHGYLAEKVRGGSKVVNGVGRNDLFRYVAKISHPIIENT